MSQQIIELTCPGCGSRVTANQKECEWCHKPIIISTFNSVYNMPMSEINKYAGTYKKALSENPDDKQLNNSIAMCYLKLKLYDKALQAFEKAMEDNFDNSETFFYAAVCLLKGKKPFLYSRKIINRVLDYINAALMIEERGLYYYFIAYVKYDYFFRKNFMISPNYQECLETANSLGVSEFDIKMLFDILGVGRPECI